MTYGTISEVLTQTARERLIKTVQPVKVLEVVEIKPPDNAKMRSARGGSIIAITGRPSSAKLENIASAARQNSISQLDQLLDEAVDGCSEWGLKRRKEKLPVEAITSVTDFYYRGAEIASGQFMAPGLDLTISVLPFSGGKLDLDAFEAHEYTQEPAEDIDSLIIVSQPQLTELEEQILAQVPPTDTGSIIGGQRVDYALPAVGLVLLGVAVIFYGLYRVALYMQQEAHARGRPPAGLDIDAGPGAEVKAALREIDPTAPARALLEARARMVAAGTLWT
jgi:hypothetical protein